MSGDLTELPAQAGASTPLLRVRALGRQPYLPVWRAMQHHTDTRTEDSADELWLTEHDPVYTLGQAGKWEHVLAAGDIPVLPVDRGGQVTYHGPGQLMAYPLLDLRRRSLGVRALVDVIEGATLALLHSYCIDAQLQEGAPGVYVRGQKIMALGLRIRRGCSFHGLALNVCMDLEPFSRINPCGYQGLRHTTIAEEGGPADLEIVANDLTRALAKTLNARTETVLEDASWQFVGGV
jgi:lipoyl(octanoyl) transferase